jgi:hypothetical protein
MSRGLFKRGLLLSQHNVIDGRESPRVALGRRKNSVTRFIRAASASLAVVRLLFAAHAALRASAYSGRAASGGQERQEDLLRLSW